MIVDTLRSIWLLNLDLLKYFKRFGGWISRVVLWEVIPQKFVRTRVSGIELKTDSWVLGVMFSAILVLWDFLLWSIRIQHDFGSCNNWKPTWNRWNYSQRLEISRNLEQINFYCCSIRKTHTPSLFINTPKNKFNWPTNLGNDPRIPGINQFSLHHRHQRQEIHSTIEKYAPKKSLKPSFVLL